MRRNLRTFVIANPQARAGAVGRDWPRIQRLLRARVDEVDFAFTEGPGHATILARQALRAGWEMIVCIGGDGTCNEVVGGFFEEPDATQDFALTDDGWIRSRGTFPAAIEPEAVLGFLPLGTGGDFRRTLGWMGGIKENIDRLEGRETRKIDVGYIGYLAPDGSLEGRIFVNIASAGFSGAVDAVINRMWKGLGGGVTFRMASLGAYVGWSNPEVEIRIDTLEEHRGKFFNMVMANGQFFGGGMWVAPGASLDDGKLQAVMLGDLNTRKLVPMIRTIYQGRHLDSPDVFRRTAEEIAIRPIGNGAPVRVDIDGEQPGHLPAHTRIIPGALHLKI